MSKGSASPAALFVTNLYRLTFLALTDLHRKATQYCIVGSLVWHVIQCKRHVVHLK